MRRKIVNSKLTGDQKHGIVGPPLRDDGKNAWDTKRQVIVKASPIPYVVSLLAAAEDLLSALFGRDVDARGCVGADNCLRHMSALATEGLGKFRAAEPRIKL